VIEAVKPMIFNLLKFSLNPINPMIDANKTTETLQIAKTVESFQPVVE
jgi:hypothetical protein